MNCYCGRRIMVITQASQACDAGSIPVARSTNFKKQRIFPLLFLFFGTFFLKPLNTTRYLIVKSNNFYLF